MFNELEINSPNRESQTHLPRWFAKGRCLLPVIREQNVIKRENLIFNAGYLKLCLNDLRVIMYALKQL